MAIDFYSNVEVNQELKLKGTAPTLRFTDTDTGADSYLTGSSSGGALALYADSGSESNTTKIYFGCDGDEVAHFRGNNSYVGSLRLFPEQNNNTAQGIFMGTEGDGTYDGSSDWSNRRVINFDTSSVLHLNAGTSTSGPLQVGTSNVTATGDVDVTGSVKITQNLRRTVTTASESSNTHTITLNDNDNFNITATNATNTIALTVASENVGQSGMIVITNPASVGSLAFAALPSYMLTPDGATVNFVTTANAIHIITYYVHATDKVLCNYIGNFA